MGGKALKEFGVTRIPQCEYENRLKQLTSFMGSLPDGVSCRWFVPGGVVKDDHGDLDILYCSPDSKLVVDHFKRLMGSSGSKKNGNVTSIEWMKFQVDFIHIAPEKFDFACHYYAHGTYAALVGKLARYYGFKLGWSGLSVYLQTKNKQYELTLTRDWGAAMHLLGYDSTLRADQTYHIDDLYKHLISSTLISKKIYQNSKPDRNYGFQEEFFDWIDIQAKVPYNVHNRQYGWIMLAKHNLLLTSWLAFKFCKMWLGELFQPIKRRYRKFKHVHLYPFAFRCQGWL